ncbi:hypothetical protein [Halapricum desulfuricans]|uniref:Uncharacterized protein n=1 Tax=Halapricum desulfuricans TaxID=2841257 RepID=A0A897NUS2_9EURY|nr:hypothetical protein [Halapricum desulfuricans]QSG13906.1 hypothetical protein HSEST_0357 [Halapricum desulfuricans]
MHSLKHIIVALVVVSAFAITGCSDVEMTADTSPGSETPENYDVDIKEPTNGTIFDNLYVYRMCGHHSYVKLSIRNQSRLDYSKVEIIKYENVDLGNKTVNKSQSTERVGHEERIYLTVPYQDYVSERNYRLEAYRTGHVVDAVNVTITQTGSDSGWL